MKKAIKPIPTWYKGHYFRSRLEARWAVFFDYLGIEWEYEKQGYEINGVPYLPDFFLPNFGFFEVKADDVEYDCKTMQSLADYANCPVIVGKNILDPKTAESYGSMSGDEITSDLTTYIPALRRWIYGAAAITTRWGKVWRKNDEVCINLLDSYELGCLDQGFKDKAKMLLRNVDFMIDIIDNNFYCGFKGDGVEKFPKEMVTYGPHYIIWSGQSLNNVVFMENDTTGEIKLADPINQGQKCELTKHRWYHIDGKAYKAARSARFEHGHHGAIAG